MPSPLPLPPADTDRLADYHFQFGHDAGNLAFVLDQLTEVLQLLGQHGIYCRVDKGPRADEAPLDLVELNRQLHVAKMLVQESHLRLRDCAAS